GDFGGSTNGMVVHWPRGVKARGELRNQFHHVIDLAPTVMEVAGLPFPRSVNGTTQKPFEGVSLAYTFGDPRAPGRHQTQYFEIAGSRAIYHNGWVARSIHRVPWEPQPRATLQADVWELYDTSKDFSLSKNLASEYPEKLNELQALFLEEALKYNVLPLDDRSIERMDPALAGRPDLMGARTSLTLYPGMTGMMENTFLNVKGRSSTVTAEVDIPPGGARGVILAQGGRFGGWSLHLKDGKPTYTYNWVGLERFEVSAPDALPAGQATIVVDFAYDGGGRGKGGTATLSVNGQKVAEGRIPKTNAYVFSLDEGADVGMDEDTPVSESYQAGSDSRFTGSIRSVTLKVR
ncbi:arylsulfatase, partial [bacterium CPR1]|nr:arylsulfatase [bacterium CPR1]